MYPPIHNKSISNTFGIYPNISWMYLQYTLNVATNSSWMYPNTSQLYPPIHPEYITKYILNVFPNTSWTVVFLNPFLFNFQGPWGHRQIFRGRRNKLHFSWDNRRQGQRPNADFFRRFDLWTLHQSPRDQIPNWLFRLKQWSAENLFCCMRLDFLGDFYQIIFKKFEVEFGKKCVYAVVDFPLNATA